MTIFYLATQSGIKETNLKDHQTKPGDCKLLNYDDRFDNPFNSVHILSFT